MRLSSPRLLAVVATSLALTASCALELEPNAEGASPALNEVDTLDAPHDAALDADVDVEANDSDTAALADNDTTVDLTSEAGLIAAARSLFGSASDALHSASSPTSSSSNGASTIAGSAIEGDVHPQFAWPLEGRISSGFGVRKLDEDGGRETIHDAIDIVAGVGSEVKAPADAVVRYVGYRNNAGRFVVADTVDGAWTFTFAHLSHVDVFEQQHIARGDVIGLTGASGNVTGPHLHFRIERVDPNGRTAVDPLPLLTHEDSALPHSN